MPPKPAKVTQQLIDLLNDTTVSARSVVDFVVGPTCGLESLHNWNYRKNMTPFLLAVEANRLDVAQLLVAEHSANTRAMADRNYTALHFASENSNLGLVLWLVEQCELDVHSVDADGQSSLTWAICFKRNEVALLLLELGADPNHSNNQGPTPLHWACIKGLVDVARALIAKGASRDAVNSEGKTPLDLADQYHTPEWRHYLEQGQT